MGCGCDNQQLDRSSAIVTIWGDYFNHDTRALIAICEIANIPRRFEEVNTFKK